MKKNSACLVLNGEIKDYLAVKTYIKNCDYNVVIAVDGGANHLDIMGINPDFLVGDLDSISDRVKNKLEDSHVKINKLPRKKNLTDTQNAVELCLDLKVDEIDLFGATGNRKDHEFANILLLEYILNLGLSPRIITEDEEIYILEDSQMNLHGKTGDIVSVIPIKGDASGLTLEGFEYTLDNFTMEFSKSRGISNIMTKDSSFIKVDKGCILIFRNRRLG